MSKLDFSTQILHLDRKRENSMGGVHQPIHNSVQYGFSTTAELVDVFQGKSGYSYSRQGTPTTTALEEKITLMEGGINSICFATGMAALSAVFFTLLKAEDHLISSNFIFGNTNSLLSTLAGLGVEISFVDATDADNIQQAIRPNTKMVFVETLANPSTQIADISNIGSLCKQHELLFVLDNTLITPSIMLGKDHGADLIVNSLSKHISGHGNALGGAVTDTGLFDWSKYSNIDEAYRKNNPKTWGLTQIKKKGLRDMGATMASDTAHRISVGSETLNLRIAKACNNALNLALALEKHKKISNVAYPGLQSHPQHDRAKQLFNNHYGTLLCVQLSPEIDIFDFLDKLKVFVLATHLGDNRSLILPVAHTIYYEMGAVRRAQMGITDNMLRISVGIEDTDNLINDFLNTLDEI